jgi:hypothetical protein
VVVLLWLLLLHEWHYDLPPTKKSVLSDLYDKCTWRPCHLRV